MQQFDIEKVNLPKWPCLIVQGKPVTKDQAMEIIIRTSGFYFSTNDDEFKRQIWEAFGAKTIDRYGTPEGEEILDIQQKYGALNLEYLNNNRITSCFVGGPHGWCNWNGMIFSNNYNIGKWPSAQEVLNEWTIIAEAFPYLNLRCQLLSGESSEATENETIKPVIEYVVKKGKVKAIAPESEICPADNNNVKNLLAMMSGAFKTEQGCTIEILKKAITITDQRVNAQAKIQEAEGII